MSNAESELSRDELASAVETAADRVREAQDRVMEDLERREKPDPPTLDTVVRRADDLRDMVDEDTRVDRESDQPM